VGGPGATKAPSNNPDTIIEATEELMRELMARNRLEPERMVSCIFTSTHDLNAEFPAVPRAIWGSTGCRSSARRRWTSPARCLR
jgi:chorismate mutase